MESKTKNKKSREQIEAMAARAFNGAALAAGEDAISELKEGWFNVAYCVRLSDGREVILKIAPPKGVEVLTYEKNIMDTEVASMRLARQNPAIPVPQIYYYDTALDLCDSVYFFMEKLAGENYEHVKKSLSQETVVQIDRQIGGVIREINQFTGTYFGLDGNRDLRADNWKEAFFKLCNASLEDGIRKGAAYGFPIEDIRAAILKHLPALEPITTPVMVHWDLWDLNIFIKDGKITGVLDFERVMWAEPLMEAQFRHLSWGGVTEHMVGYGKTTFSHAEMQRCTLYTLYLGLVMKTECYYRNYGSDDISNMALNVIAPAMRWLQQN
ncbi:MAG: aminoglycoside phosphotransferase family protein [Anaerolineales bacterium]|jgi:aminoglycoside phosphotransferase (APT) family kinase protein|nr:aminoglycoside phosphotransferase family protein [Anaerolineales bacterium]